MYQPKRLIQAQFISSTTGILYTTPTSVMSKITQISVSNTDVAAQTFSIFLTPGILAPTAFEEIVKAKVLAPGEVWLVYPVIGIILPAGSSIQAVASIADKLVITSSGLDIA